MDTGITIITIVLIAVSILPFYLLNRKNKRKRKLSEDTLSNVAEKNGSQIGQSEFWSQLVVAIDTAGAKLFFSNHSPDPDSYTVIELAEVKKCTLLKTEVDNKIRKLELQFVFGGNNPNKVLEFYSEDHRITIVNEWQSINKWHDIVTAIIDKK